MDDAPLTPLAWDASRDACEVLLEDGDRELPCSRGAGADAGTAPAGGAATGEAPRLRGAELRGRRRIDAGFDPRTARRQQQPSGTAAGGSVRSLGAADAGGHRSSRPARECRQWMAVSPKVATRAARANRRIARMRMESAPEDRGPPWRCAGASSRASWCGQVHVVEVRSGGCLAGGETCDSELAAERRTRRLRLRAPSPRRGSWRGSDEARRGRRGRDSRGRDGPRGGAVPPWNGVRHGAVLRHHGDA